jgi:uncharacterized protein (TIGR00369 family)
VTAPCFVAQDPAYEARVRASFAQQRAMATLGVTIARVAPGEVVLALPYRADLTQQHGYMHAGVVAAIADSACGYAAFTLMPADSNVLSVEFKVNLMAPARGERFEARARVLRAGRTITTCQADVVAFEGGEEKVVATLLGTMMCVPARP